MFLVMCFVWLEMDLFDFPPLFTLQPNLATRSKQLVVWQRILEQHSGHYFDSSMECFQNPGINRRIEDSLFHELGVYLHKEGLGEWDNTSRILFYKKPISVWGTLIHELGVKNGNIGTVESVVSLRNEDLLKSVPLPLIFKALKYLQTKGKCEVFSLTADHHKLLPETSGVKFFP